MAYIYILRSLKNGKYYIGSTTNLERRLGEHNMGEARATTNARPWEIAFKMWCQDLTLARTIEARLKRLKSRKIIEAIIKDGEIKFLRG